MSAQVEPVLVLACGALAREIQQLKLINGWEHLKIKCLEADLHNRPERIPERIRADIQRYRPKYSQIFVAYADCGTGGLLDKVLAEENIERLPGAHCYATFAGQQPFAELAEAELGSFYLTDFLARHFERLVIKGMQLDKHPELLPLYFNHYKRLVYLAQTSNPDLLAKAQAAAEFLHLEFKLVPTGYGELATELARIAQR
ncbi:DUF1638 domain-containing protein [uncultured Thiothrix sp.]|uniref:DUF1638 domain-containing protein n=1 Tax=uncultured Thiothrix sp. TaxID=223185 RepID=UPI0026084D6C|nr:DUF1638 domain-containing protein [uncultured Thiothrix sp.]